MSGRILLVEDDAAVREMAAGALERAGFVVDAVERGDMALEMVLSGKAVDLIVLDVMLPGANGFDVCRQVRAASGTPIVMLTARSDTVDVVTALELGADDYVTKPFDGAELAARVRAVLRRGATRSDSTVACRDVTVDGRAFRAFRGDCELALTTLEFRLLDVLVCNVGRVFTREELLEQVWGYEYLGDSRLVDMAVKRLRAKLGEPTEPPPYVTTVRRIGYRFEPG